MEWSAHLPLVGGGGVSVNISLFLDIFYNSTVSCMVSRLFVIHLDIFGHMFYIFLMNFQI